MVITKNVPICMCVCCSDSIHFPCYVILTVVTLITENDNSPRNLSARPRHGNRNHVVTASRKNDVHIETYKYHALTAPGGNFVLIKSTSRMRWKKSRTCDRNVEGLNILKMQTQLSASHLKLSLHSSNWIIGIKYFKN